MKKSMLSKILQYSLMSIQPTVRTSLSIEESGWVPKVYPPDSFDRDFIRCCTVTLLSIEESGWVPKTVLTGILSGAAQ